jgi:transposase-like protein
MQILHPFAGSIEQYSEHLKDPDLYRPRCCPLCEAKTPLVTHGFYSRSIVDCSFDGSIRVRRYLCRLCRRTVSLLPGFVLPYVRFAITVIARFLKARLLGGLTLKRSSEIAGQPEMPYQRGQHWIRRFRAQAARVSAALVALARPEVASDFVTRTVRMLEATGWIPSHRFLFSKLRVHFLGWPNFLAPDGRCRAL